MRRARGRGVDGGQARGLEDAVVGIFARVAERCAGGGEELGGTIGLRLYMQRVAVQGAKGVVDRMTRGD